VWSMRCARHARPFSKRMRIIFISLGSASLQACKSARSPAACIARPPAACIAADSCCICSYDPVSSHYSSELSSLIGSCLNLDPLQACRDVCAYPCSAHPYRSALRWSSCIRIRAPCAQPPSPPLTSKFVRCSRQRLCRRCLRAGIVAIDQLVPPPLDIEKIGA
jgi:hypothetical protein